MLSEDEMLDAGMRALWALVEREGGIVTITAEESRDGTGIIRIARYGDGKLTITTRTKLDG